MQYFNLKAFVVISGVLDVRILAVVNSPSEGIIKICVFPFSSILVDVKIVQ